MRKISRHALVASVILTGVAPHAGRAASEQPVASDEQKSAAVASSPAGLEEIVVTARKRAENLQEVPISISAISGAALQRQAITTVGDAAEMTPNVYIQYIPAGPIISMRGLSNINASGEFESGVGLGIDGQFYPKPRWMEAGMFDIESFAVLRGPQSTYFGKNTSVGLIDITTKGPTDTLQGFASVGGELAVGGLDAEGAIGGPITDNFSARLAILDRTSDGYNRVNNSDNKVPYTHDRIARLSLKWDVTDDLTITNKTTYYYNKVEGNDAETGVCSPGWTGLLQAFPGGAPVDDCRLNYVVSPTPPIPEGSIHHGVLTRNEGESNVLAGNYKFGDGYTLTAVAGFQTLDTDWYIDGSYSPIPLFYAHRPEKYTQYSQELRLLTPSDRTFQFLFGVYHDSSHYEFPVTLDINLPVLGLPPGSGFTLYRNSNVAGDSLAEFGEATWNVTKAIRAIVGVRYTDERKHDSIFEYRGVLGNPYSTGATDINAKQTLHVTNFSPSFTAQWDFVPGSQVYASFKTGFKSGGFDPDPASPAAVADFLKFRPEKAKTYEIGFKTELFDRRLRINGDIFRNNFSNLQVSEYIPSLFAVVTTNAPAATTRGAELEARWRATDSLTLDTEIGYTQSHYGYFPGPCFGGQTVAEGCTNNIQQLQGKQITDAPRWTVALGAAWQHEAFQDYDVFVTAHAHYRSQVSTTLDHDPLTFNPQTWLVDATVSLEPQAGTGWGASVIAKNLTNKLYWTGVNGFFLPHSYAYTVAPPTTVELVAKYTF